MKVQKSIPYPAISMEEEFNLGKPPSPLTSDQAKLQSTLIQKKRQSLTTRFPSQPKSVTVTKTRKKAFAHKTRTGCQCCKQRHIKCTEERPVCQKCKKAGLERFCEYRAPKAWLFDSEGRTAVKGLSIGDASPPYSKKAAIGVPDSLQIAYGSLEEKRALQHWIVKTGSWLSNYANTLEDRKTWTEIFPRCSHTQPATKHLIVAISMVDERLPDPTPELLMYRSRRVLFHYNQAIQELTQRKPSMVDAVGSSLLAWVLETCLQDTNRAIMHLDASTRLFEAIRHVLSRKNESEASDILKRMEDAKESCSGYLSTQRRVRALQSRNLSNIFAVIDGRNGPQSMQSTEEARSQIDDYFTKFENSDHGQVSVAEARDWLRSWEYTLVKFRYISTRHDLNIVAIHILVNLAKTLVPRHAETSHEEADQYVDDTTDHMAALLLSPSAGGTLHMDGQYEGIAYVLDRCTGIWSVSSQLKAEDKLDLAATINLAMEKVIVHAREQEHRDRAKQLLQVIASDTG